MRVLRKFASTTVVAFVAAALTACGGANQPAGQAAAPDQAGSAAAPEEPIPAAFDNTRGWQVEETGTGTEFADPVVAERAGLVLLRASDSTTSHLVARDARTGAVRWTSKPVAGSGRDGTGSLIMTSKDGKEYAVLATTGAEGGNGVNRSRTTTLYVYEVTSSGATEPPREMIVPGKAEEYIPQADGVVLVGVDGTVTAADVTDGGLTAYRKDDPAMDAPKPCEQLVGSCNTLTKVVAVTPDGPLVQGFRAFWVPGGWFSGDAIPPGASANEGSHDVEVVGSPDGESVLAVWPQQGSSSTDRVWAVHDGRTGQVQASVTCEQRVVNGNSVATQPSLSPSGRYLVSDVVAFDLQTKKGFCFGKTSSHNAIRLVTVDDDGTAYGTAAQPSASGGDSPVPVNVSASTGQVTPLPAGTRIPDRLGGAVAVFGTRTNGGEAILCYPRR